MFPSLGMAVQTPAVPVYMEEKSSPAYEVDIKRI